VYIEGGEYLNCIGEERIMDLMGAYWGNWDDNLHDGNLGG
jgi:hypothetical protein